MKPVVKICCYRDRVTGGNQMAVEDEIGGYRIAGPKFCGASTPIMEVTLSERDANEIRSMLDRVFPKEPYND